MSRRAAITVNRPRAEVEGLWRGSPPLEDAEVTFKEAPGDRGTEIHVQVGGGSVGAAIKKVVGTEPLAKAKDELRHFKQLAETGVIARSDASPEGEQLGRKFKQRPAQPVEEEVGSR
jgi:hypothetical protein